MAPETNTIPNDIAGNTTGFQTPAPVNIQNAYTYAGFWMRFVAVILDSLILFIPMCILNSVLISIMTVSFAEVKPSSFPYTYPSSVITTFFIFIIGIYVLNYAAVILYNALFEISRMQGTPGKRTLGLIVTDEMGNKITFSRSIGRNLGKIVSGMILYVGFIMAGFTEKKQALHDIMARTLVLRKI
jgi:uncharacterized RDD family membrane protein YckC